MPSWIFCPSRVFPLPAMGAASGPLLSCRKKPARPRANRNHWLQSITQQGDWLAPESRRPFWGFSTTTPSHIFEELPARDY
jgi:hypothetical protein